MTDSRELVADSMTVNRVEGAASESSVRTVRVLRSLGEIEEIREIWNRWHVHPNSDFDFYHRVLSSLPEIIRPHLILVYRGEVPESMLIGRLETRELAVRFGYLRFLNLQLRSLTFIYAGHLGADGETAGRLFVESIMDSLRNKEADIAFFNLLNTTSGLFKAVTHLPGRLSRDYFLSSQAHRSLRMPNDVEGLYAGLSKKARKNQRWQAKKLLQDHANQVEVRCIRSIEALEEGLRDVEAIAKTTYHRALGIGFDNTPQLKQLLQFQAEKEWLRIYILYVQGIPWAFWIGRVYGGTFHSDYMGYCPDHASYSPGMFLIMKVLEEWTGDKCEPVRTLDFGFGDAQYKEVLGTESWQESSAFLFAPRIKIALVQLIRIPSVLVTRLVESILARTGLAQKVKTAWRSRARIQHAGR